MNGYIACFDPSLNSFGYSILKLTELRGNKHKVEIIECTNIPNAHFDKSQRGHKLLHIERRLYVLRNVYNPIVVVKEQVQAGGHDQLVALAGVHGLIDKVFSHMEIVSYEPTTMKKRITGGNGKADKLEIQQALRKWVGDMCFSTDDSSDSLAIGYVWLLEQGIVSA